MDGSHHVNAAKLLQGCSAVAQPSGKGLSHPALAHLPSRPRIFPVIHVSSIQQTLENAIIAHNLDCDGVFLINHGVPSSLLLDCFKCIKKNLPGLFVGINILSEWTPVGVFETIAKAAIVPDGIWIDNAEINEMHPLQGQSVANAIQRRRKELGLMDPLYFGGVDFKYQRKVSQDQLSKVAFMATYFMDIVCTSGDATGVAPSIEKCKLMSAGAKRSKNGALAIASGVDEDNVEALLEAGAAAILVASSVAKDFHNLDPEKLERLVQKIHAFGLEKGTASQSSI